MDTFEDLKTKAERKMQEALKKQQEIIDEQRLIIKSYEKLKIGNIIECRLQFKLPDIYTKDNTIILLIVGNAYIKDNKFMIPIRHHIYPILKEESIGLNMSGVVDLLAVPIDKIDDLKVMSVSEYFNRMKPEISEKWNASIRDCKRYIEHSEQQIEYHKKEIERNKKWLEKYEGCDIDANVDIYINNYIHSNDYAHSFKNVHESRLEDEFRARIYSYSD